MTPRSFARVIAIAGTVTTAGSAQDPLPPGRPTPAPILSIGAEGQPDYEFTRIQAALRAASGEIALVDAANSEIRVFGPTGRLVRKLGRNGEGPGEFRQISMLFVAGDTLIAYDAVLRRLTWYLIGGQRLKTTQFEYPADQGPLYIGGRLANGRWLVTTGHSPSWEHGSGTYRDTTRVGLIAESATGAITWLGGVPGVTFFVNAPAGRQSEWRVGMLPYSPLPIIATWKDTVIVGDLGSAEIRMIAPSGAAVRSLRLPRPIPVGTLDAARKEELAAAGTESSRAFTRLAYDAAEKADGLRIWDSAVVADNGELWLGIADRTPSAERRYIVVTPAGRARATWLLPPRSRLLSVYGNQLCVVTRDENDVEHLIVIAL